MTRKEEFMNKLGELMREYNVSLTVRECVSYEDIYAEGIDVYFNTDDYSYIEMGKFLEEEDFLNYKEVKGNE